MELVVARCGNNPRTRCRHGVPRMVRMGAKRLGDGRHHPLSLRNVVELHRFDCISRPFYMVAWKERLRKWDHAAIYWHIAGSYSPITLVALREYSYWGWALFIFIWVSAIAGTVKSFMGLKSHSYVETICYVVMGLSVLVAFGPLLHSVGPSAVIWIIAEGVCYITGALFYCLRKRRFMHTVFHFFVLAGSVCHIIAVWDILMKWL